MAWILLCFDVLPTIKTREGSHAMRHHNTVFHAVLKFVKYCIVVAHGVASHHNTVFHAVLKFVPWHVLDRLVDEFAANKKVRRLTTQNQFIALLYAQLAGSESLRAI